MGTAAFERTAACSPEWQRPSVCTWQPLRLHKTTREKGTDNMWLFSERQSPRSAANMQKLFHSLHIAGSKKKKKKWDVIFILTHRFIFQKRYFSTRQFMTEPIHGKCRKKARELVYELEFIQRRLRLRNWAVTHHHTCASNKPAHEAPFARFMCCSQAMIVEKHLSAFVADVLPPPPPHWSPEWQLHAKGWCKAIRRSCIVLSGAWGNRNMR